MAHGAKVYVAGHRGLLGSALVRGLRAAGFENLVTLAHAELDLGDGGAVRAFFARERPEYVFLAAAKVGGILANATYPADFIRENLSIETHVIDAAYRAGVQRLLFVGSSCIYPRDCPQPMREESLLSGPLEPTNRPYAIAKIAGIELCWAYNRQYGTRYLAVMPANLYGPGDHYDLETSHVLPALIRKMHEARVQGEREVVVWGSGTPRREFLYSDDAAAACVFVMGLPDETFDPLLHPGPAVPPLLNIGCGEDLTIRELAELVRSVVGCRAEIRWDAGQPDGTPRKLLDVSRLQALGWCPRIGLREGLRRAYRAYLEEHGADAGPRAAAAIGLEGP
ncbi:MAG: GDP-L-fucose synthase family protein [Gammaproteobacteria bacterium]